MADKTFKQVQQEVMRMARKTGMDEMDAIAALRRRLKEEGIPLPKSINDLHFGHTDFQDSILYPQVGQPTKFWFSALESTSTRACLHFRHFFDEEILK